MPSSSDLLLVVLHLALSTSAVYFVGYQLIAHIKFQPWISDMCNVDTALHAMYAFTHIQGFDKQVCKLSEFFLSLLQPGTSSRYMMYDLMAAFCVPVVVPFFEAKRQSRSIWLASPMIFGILYQNVSGALITPIYFLILHLTSRGRAARSNITRLNAESVLFGFAVGFVVPTIGMFLGEDHRVIALWQGFPVWMSFAQAFYHSVNRYVFGRDQSLGSGFWIVQSTYLLGFVASGAAHYVTTQFSLRDTPKRFEELHRLFVPSLHLLDPATITYESIAANFIKWDAIIIMITTLFAGLYSIYRLDRSRDDFKSPMLWLQAVMVVAVFGPGALLALVFMWRESNLRSVREDVALAEKEKTL